MHNQNRKNFLYAEPMICSLVVSQKRLANMHYLGNITYFLGKIRNTCIVVVVPLKVWIHELQ